MTQVRAFLTDAGLCILCRIIGGKQFRYGAVGHFFAVVIVRQGQRAELFRSAVIIVDDRLKMLDAHIFYIVGKLTVQVHKDVR